MSRNFPTSTSLLSSDSPAPKCSYCQQQHSSNSCKSVTDPSERKRILRSTGRCFVCLRKHHTSRECRSTLKCTKCNGRHHVSICAAAPMQGSPNTTTGTTSNGDRQRQTAQQNQPSSTTNQNIPIGPTPTTTALQCTTAKVPVLLQTARVHVFNPANPVMSMGVRLIFDSGSQRSYVTDKIKQLISLDCQSVKAMLIKMFGLDKGSK